MPQLLKPSREQMRAARAAIACPLCKVAAGVVCIHPSNTNTESGIPDHMLRVFTHIAMVAPELAEVEARPLLLQLGWYLQPGMLLRKTRAYPTVTLYMHTGAGHTTATNGTHGWAVQRDRLHLSLVMQAVGSGWLLQHTNSRTDFYPTLRGIATAQRLAPEDGWSRGYVPPVMQTTAEIQRRTRVAEGIRMRRDEAWIGKNQARWDEQAGPRPGGRRVRQGYGG